MADVTIPDLAERLGTVPQRLRKFLRANFPRVDKGNKYEWVENDFELDKIEEQWKSSGGSSRPGGRKETKRTRASKLGKTLDLNPDGPDPPVHKTCTWCREPEVELIKVFAIRLNDNEDQKRARYRCTNPKCLVEDDRILTMGGWVAPPEMEREEV